MAFVQGMCPECGGMLAVDNAEKASICLFCGKAFIVKEAIDKANVNNAFVDTKQSNVIENDWAIKSEEFIIEKGVLKKYVGSSEDVVIPYGVFEIGEKAFFNCDKIKTVKFSDSVESICKAAFQFCEGIKAVELPGSLKTIGEEAFSNCARLESIVVPKGVTDIGVLAFEDCESLESVVISEGVTEIKYGTFSGCTHLVKISLPDSLERIGERCFEVGSKPKCVYVNSIDTWKNIVLGNFTDANPLYPVGKLYVNGVLVTEGF